MIRKRKLESAKLEGKTRKASTSSTSKLLSMDVSLYDASSR